MGLTVAYVDPVVLALKRNLLAMFCMATDTLALIAQKPPAPGL